MIRLDPSDPDFPRALNALLQELNDRVEKREKGGFLTEVPQLALESRHIAEDGIDLQTKGVRDESLPSRKIATDAIIGRTIQDDAVKGEHIGDFPGKRVGTTFDKSKYKEGMLVLGPDGIPYIRNSFSTVGREILKFDPFLYFKLDESSGTVAEDSSGNGNTGTYNNTPTLGVDGLLQDGGKAVDFANATENVDTSFTQENITSLSIEFWIKTAFTTVEQTIIVGDRTASSIIDFSFQGTSGSASVATLRAVVDQTIFNFTTLAAVLFDDVARHVVVTWDGTAPGTLKVYIDGGLKETLTAVASGSTLGIDNYTIGSNASPLLGMTGELDNFAIYHDRVLTAAEVAKKFEEQSLANDKQGFDPLFTAAGIVPIGAIIWWATHIKGVPGLPGQFVECNGQTLDDPDSPLDGQLLPDINSSTTQGRFIRGTDGVTGTLQAADAGTHTHDMGSHFHSTAHGHDSNNVGYWVGDNPVFGSDIVSSSVHTLTIGNASTASHRRARTENKAMGNTGQPNGLDGDVHPVNLRMRAIMRVK